MCQNSGLGNAVNPLTSLNAPFRIPTLFITTWRGQPGIADEPQHEVMGRITPQLLSLMGVDNAPFPNAPATIAAAFTQASETMAATEAPFAWVMCKGDVAETPLNQSPLPRRGPGRRDRFDQGAEPPSREQVLRAFLALADPEAGVIASTGKCGRELFTLDDRDQHLYQVGSMGGASGMALGVALNSERPVVVLDGDGAALMKLGALATIGAYGPKRLTHILLDNGVHDSTGGQATVSASVDFAAVALACGYDYAVSCDSLQGFEQAYRAAQIQAGPRLIHMKIASGSMAKLGRPTIKPFEVARRFRAFLASPMGAEAAA